MALAELLAFLRTRQKPAPVVKPDEERQFRSDDVTLPYSTTVQGPGTISWVAIDKGRPQGGPDRLSVKLDGYDQNKGWPNKLDIPPGTHTVSFSVPTLEFMRLNLTRR